MSSASKRTSSVCYPFSERHLMRHLEKSYSGSYRVRTFEDQMRKIHLVRIKRQSLRLDTESMESDECIQVRSEEIRNVESRKYRAKGRSLRRLEIPRTGNTPNELKKVSWGCKAL